MACRHERDFLRVVRSYVESGFNVTDALQKANSSANKKHIRTFTPPDVGDRLRVIMEDFQKQSDAYAKEHGRPFYRCVCVDMVSTIRR